MKGRSYGQMCPRLKERPLTMGFCVPRNGWEVRLLRCEGGQRTHQLQQQERSPQRRYRKCVVDRGLPPRRCQGCRESPRAAGPERRSPGHKRSLEVACAVTNREEVLSEGCFGRVSPGRLGCLSGWSWTELVGNRSPRKGQRQASLHFGSSWRLGLLRLR